MQTIVVFKKAHLVGNIEHCTKIVRFYEIPKKEQSFDKTPKKLRFFTERTSKITILTVSCRLFVIKMSLISLPFQINTFSVKFYYVIFSKGPKLPVTSNAAENRKFDSRKIIVNEMFQNCTIGFLLPKAEWLFLKNRRTSNDRLLVAKKKCKDHYLKVNT